MGRRGLLLRRLGLALLGRLAVLGLGGENLPEHPVKGCLVEWVEIGGVGLLFLFHLIFVTGDGARLRMCNLPTSPSSFNSALALTEILCPLEKASM